MRLTLLAVLLVVSPLSIAVGQGESTTPRQQLKELVEQLKQSSNDSDLRERIVELASKLKPTPAPPEEAREHFLRGNSALKNATGPDDFDRAIDQYQQASVLAPWWADIYFNEAKALEGRKRYDDAIRMLKLCLKAEPSSPNARAEQDMIYELEDKAEKWNSSPKSSDKVAERIATLEGKKELAEKHAAEKEANDAEEKLRRDPLWPFRGKWFQSGREVPTLDVVPGPGGVLRIAKFWSAASDRDLDVLSIDSRHLKVYMRGGSFGEVTLLDDGRANIHMWSPEFDATGVTEEMIRR